METGLSSSDKSYIFNLYASRYKKMMSKVKKIKEQKDKHFDSYFNRKDHK